MKKFVWILGLCALSACGDVSFETSMEVRASRAFAGPTQFPPSGFAGYGILVFPSDPASHSERFQMFCQAYLASFLSSNDLAERGVAIADQMVTVLPVDSDFLARDLGSLKNTEACKLASKRYDLGQAQNAIKKAEAAANLTDGLAAINGRGPFLLAWSPGSTFGSRDALVLTANLSNTSTPEQAASDMQTWRKDIESDPTQWRDGWNIEGIRLIAQRWVDRRGDAIVKLIGKWS